MDSKRIEQLLEKYWECETTLDEEKALREFFNQAEVPLHLKESASLFRYFEQQRQQVITDVAFEGRVKKAIEPPKGKVRSLVYSSLRIAAGISVVLASFWLVRTQIREDQPQEITDTYDDPKKAFEETKKALQMISKNFSKGQKATAKLNLINEAKDKIQTKDNDKADS